MPKTTIRLDENGNLIDVEVDGHKRPTELAEERGNEPKPIPSFGEHTIQGARLWGE